MRQLLPILFLGLFLLLACLVALLLRGNAPKDQWLRAQPQGIMGTETLVVVQGRAEHLVMAEGELRRLEALLSSHLNYSQLRAFGRSAPGVPFQAGPELLELFSLAQSGNLVSQGTFDATLLPLIRLWKEAGKNQILPTSASLAAARNASNWTHFSRVGNTLIRSSSTACLDLGGLAKGWAAQRVARMLQEAGVKAGMVQVGGDTRVFGEGPDGAKSWTIDIRRPDGQGVCGTLHLRDVSVSTSGNYQRFATIGGQRYSHIIDPRSGLTADHLPGVTIVAPSGVQTEVWSKAISVLGEQGFALLPPGVEAIILLDAQGSEKKMSPGMKRYLAPEGK